MRKSGNKSLTFFKSPKVFGLGSGGHREAAGELGAVQRRFQDPGEVLGEFWRISSGLGRSLVMAWSSGGYLGSP